MSRQNHRSLLHENKAEAKDGLRSKKWCVANGLSHGDKSDIIEEQMIDIVNFFLSFAINFQDDDLSAPHVTQTVFDGFQLEDASTFFVSFFRAFFFSAKFMGWMRANNSEKFMIKLKKNCMNSCINYGRQVIARQHTTLTKICEIESMSDRIDHNRLDSRNEKN